nr:microcephalin isoform X1 [Ipomoea batatas]
MAPKKASSIPSPPPIPIGNCEVRVEAKNFASESTENSLRITFSKDAHIKISVMENRNCEMVNFDPQGSENEENGLGNYWFELINPKDADGKTKCLVQEVLNIYVKELPAMKYAANTGKQSLFLDKCVSSGKYCTLISRIKQGEHHGEVVAATTYQIISADTQYAEIPLAAVRSQYQHKGIGRILYMELRRRLQNVGIRTVFCWGDKESEGFWLKQGLVVIGQVDAKGKARRLPIRADIRRALCFPGGSTLLVSHLNKESLTNSPENLMMTVAPNSPDKLPISQKRDKNVPEGNHFSNGVNQNISTDDTQHYVADTVETINCGNDANCTGVNECEFEPYPERCSCSAPGTKKRMWEASFTSLNSKKVKGGYVADCHLRSNNFLLENNGKTTMHKSGGSLAASESAFLGHDHHKDPLTCSSKYSEEYRALDVTPISNSNLGIPPLGKHFRIMLMNIADDNKKANLTKIIENLGGLVTSDGSECTHVVTGKVRKTLNFCKALCSGSWIISPSWLKESFRKGRFVDEMPFILKDEDYELKYTTELKSAVLGAKSHPQSLLNGYDICLAAHVQPPASMLSAIVKSAGGNVLGGLEEVNDAKKTVFVACEEDMDEALSAAEKGIRTFCSEWFMNCIMKQQLDLGASQFAESL